MYGKVLLMKLLATDSDISLPSLLEEKFFIHELEVNINQCIVYCVATKCKI